MRCGRSLAEGPFEVEIMLSWIRQGFLLGGNVGPSCLNLSHRRKFAMMYSTWVGLSTIKISNEAMAADRHQGNQVLDRMIYVRQQEVLRGSGMLRKEKELECCSLLGVVGGGWSVLGSA